MEQDVETVAQDRTIIRGRWGQKEWAYRMSVVKQKLDDLDECSRKVMGDQFELIAYALNREQFGQMVLKPATHWQHLIEMLQRRR